MPIKTSKKKPAAALPSIPKELIEQFVSGPMSAEAVNAASMAFKKALIERVLGAELSHHLGYPPGAEKPDEVSNHRNGVSRKTVLTDNGPLRIDIPRDREGRFEPLLIPKHERRFTGFDDKIVAMYARGMTVREIQGFLAEQYGTEVSPEFISSVTDAVMSEVIAWQSRPLEPMYPVVFFDALRVKIREDAVVRNKAIYLALGVLPDGTRDILGLWIENTEGAKFWMKIFNDLKTRGVADILLAKNIVGKVVLVTGAGGSIGSELCRQILAVNPAKLLLIEQSEFALYAIHQELEEKLAGLDVTTPPVLVPLLASVQDDDRMREIMSTWHPDTVYHAAAYKHVPLVEHNPAAGIKNNVLGTLRTAQAAAENGVSDFVLISTDKAVRPTNVMGASKRLAEMALQALTATQAGTQDGTRFSMVRFGNVLGSSGSVVPKFRQQIRDGGPITLTHPEVTRYFMTIPEAAQLVIQAGAMAKGGDVFVLDMGQPVKIMDLARRMVELSGLTVKDEQNPEGDIEIAVTGLRPGEKLYEELLIGDNPKPTVHSRIMKAHEEFIPWAEFEAKLTALEMALNVNDVGVIRLMMQQLVAGYIPSDDIVDWVYLEQEAEAQALGVAG